MSNELTVRHHEITVEGALPSEAQAAWTEFMEAKAELLQAQVVSKTLLAEAREADRLWQRQNDLVNHLDRRVRDLDVLLKKATVGS